MLFIVQMVVIYDDVVHVVQTVITCLETMQKSTSDTDAISCLILGTESKQIYVLDPQAFTILCTVSCSLNI